MTFGELWQPLQAIYDEREARAIGLWLLDVVFGLSHTDVICDGMERLSPEQLGQLQSMRQRLLAGEPIQYVAGVADFGPRQFAVAPGVLIPRPETYELCQWMEESNACGDMLDIGTGSGCIACTLSLDMPKSRITAWDISEEALHIAMNNATKTGATVCFEKVDILTFPDHRDRWDVIVSNPPYVCEQERTNMERHVLDFEPALALFVPDDDPLHFYRAIGRYAMRALKPGGLLFFELNATYAEDTARLMNEMGFTGTRLRNDQFGHPRFLKTRRP